MVRGIGDAISALIISLFVICCIAVPLGVWKLIDLAMWLFTHVKIGINW